MRLRLILMVVTLSGLILSAIGVGHSQTSSSGTRTSTGQTRKRKVKLAPGYVLLPEGYKAYLNKGGIDTWSGHIVSPESSFRIDIYGGMVGSPFGIDEDKFIWTKVEGKSKDAIKIGLKRADNGEVMVAESLWINFVAPIRHEGDRNLFLEIVRSYRNKECNGCEEMAPAPPSNNSLNRSGIGLYFIENLNAVR